MSLSTLRTPAEDDLSFLGDSASVLAQLGKPENEDDKMVRTQASRLLGVTKNFFVEPVIQELRAQNTKLRVSLAYARASLENYTVLTLGPAAVLVAIKLYANKYFGLTCHCRHCCDVFDEPRTLVEQRRCLVFIELIAEIHSCDLSYGFMQYYDGKPVEGHPPVPEDFPPKSSIFDPETLSHIDKHIVFQRMGNAYEFKFGRPLYSVDSPYHEEGFKLLELVKRLRIKSMDP